MAILKRRHSLAATVAIVLTVVSLSSQSRAPGEEEVKAAFLYNFAKYVTWPAPVEAFEVCAVAAPGFVQSMGVIVAGESIDGRPVRVLTPATPGEARRCHILYIGRGDEEQARQWLRAVNDAPVLTVGDSPRFLSEGGVVAFVTEADRVRFDINVAEARRAGLTISSRMLRVARRVSPPEKQ